MTVKDGVWGAQYEALIFAGWMLSTQNKGYDKGLLENSAGADK